MVELRWLQWELSEIYDISLLGFNIQQEIELLYMKRQGGGPHPRDTGGVISIHHTKQFMNLFSP